MISYKLAKQLKEAGFPQTEGICYVGEQRVEYAKWGFEKGTIICRIPTLSELIEACGDRFQWLSRKGKKWFTVIDTKTAIWEEKAKTPEEAVAKLWLKLNRP